MQRYSCSTYMQGMHRIQQVLQQQVPQQQVPQQQILVFDLYLTVEIAFN